MSDIRKLINIISETTAGATASGSVANVAQPMETLRRRSDEDYAAEAADSTPELPQVLEYGNWENSALTTSKKLKKARSKAKKIVKSIYGEDKPEVDETLHGKQAKLDVNKSGSLDSEDFALLRSKKKVSESRKLASNLAEGRLKQALWDDAEELSLDAFLDKHAKHNDDTAWLTDFWKKTNGVEDDKQDVAEALVNEIGFANELGKLSMSDQDILNNSIVDGQIGQRDVMRFEIGNNALYFFSGKNKIEALLLLDGSRLAAIKNFTQNKGLIHGLFNYVVNMKRKKLRIDPNDQLSPYGIDWLLKQIERSDGIKITDLNGKSINADELRNEWNKSKSDSDHAPGSTGIIIGESAMGKRLRDNERSLMPYDIFGVNKHINKEQGVAEGFSDVVKTRDMHLKAKGVKENISWSSLDEGLSVEDKMTIFEEFCINGNLTESVDQDKKDYFVSLFDLSDVPKKGEKYIVVPLALISNRIMILNKPGYIKFVGKGRDGLVFRSSTGDKVYPSKVMRELSISNTFTFASVKEYDKFRTALYLKFDTELPEINLLGKQDVTEGKSSKESTYWRVEQSEATGRYHVVTGYQKRKVYTNKLGACDFNSKESAQKKADELNQKESVTEGFKNTYNVGDRVDTPIGPGVVTMISNNVNIDGKVKVKLDDPSRAGEDGKYKDEFVFTTNMLKHLPDQDVTEAEIMGGLQQDKKLLQDIIDFAKQNGYKVTYRSPQKSWEEVRPGPGVSMLYFENNNTELAFYAKVVKKSTRIYIRFGSIDGSFLDDIVFTPKEFLKAFTHAHQKLLDPANRDDRDHPLQSFLDLRLGTIDGRPMRNVLPPKPARIKASNKQGVAEGSGPISKTKALNALRKELMNSYEYMKCGNLEEFKQRLQWLSEGMLKNHMTGGKTTAINQKEIELYKEYRKKREQIQQGFTSQGVTEGSIKSPQQQLADAQQKLMDIISKANGEPPATEAEAKERQALFNKIKRLRTQVAGSRSEGVKENVAEGLAPGQAAWKKEMMAKGAVSFKRDQHGGGAVDRIVAYDKDGKVVG
jgi:hypothetical protein